MMTSAAASPARKLLYAFFALLLILLLCASVVREASPVETKTILDADPATVGTAADLSRERLSDGAILYTPTGSDPHITYTAEAGTDKITLVFDGPTTDAMRLFYSQDGVFSRQASVEGVLSQDGTSVIFYLPAASPYNEFRICFEQPVTLRSLVHEQTLSPDADYSVNPVSAAALVVLVALLVILEKKLCFFAFLRSFLTDACLLARGRSRASKLVHALCLLCISLFCAAAVTDLLLSIVCPSYQILLTVLGALAIAAVLVKELFVLGKNRLARSFLAVSLILGTTLALSLPLTSVVSWDDEYHFFHIAGGASLLTGDFSIAEHLFKQQIILTPAFFDAPEGFAATLLSLSTQSIDPAFPFSLPEIHPLLGILVLPFAAIFLLFTYAVYLPGILSYAFLSLLGADVILRISVARLCTVALFSLAFALGIRRLKYGKRLFALTALIPTTLFLSACFSADAFISSFVALGFAYFIGELQRPDEPLSLKNATVMVGALTLGCGPKAIYFILFLPLLLLPRKKLGDKKRARKYRTVVLLTMLGVLLSFLVPFLLDPSSKTDLRGGADVSASGQIAFILSDPIGYARILLRFLGELLSLPSVTANTTFFAYLGQGDAALSSVTLLLLLYFAFTDRRRDGQADLSHAPIHRAASLLTVFAAIVLVATSLYVGFTPVGYETVLGCQFRYLFPLFPIALYFLGATRIVSHANERASTVLALGGGAMLNLCAFCSLVLSPFA